MIYLKAASGGCLFASLQQLLAAVTPFTGIFEL
jgi:hypothetical protein